MSSPITQQRFAKLESLRGFTACYVVLHHLARQYLPHKWYRLPFTFGPEAVIVFFVLSGFVIYYTTQTNPADQLLRNYAVKRVRRIYPIFIAALALAYLAQCVAIGAWFVPNFAQLAGNLLMCQGISIDPFYDGPLWSLSYEWWFYVLFFLLLKIEKQPGRRQYWAAAIAGLGLVTAAIRLNQASLFLLYFMIWWCGAEMARQFLDEGTITWQRQRFAIWMLALLAFGSIVLLRPALLAHEPLSALDPPVVFVRHLAAGVAIACAGIAWKQRRFAGFDILLGGFAVLAPISYGIYAVHMPVIVAVTALAIPAFLQIPLIILLVLGLGYVLEVPFQKQINRVTRPLLSGERHPTRLAHPIAAR